jgi:hypothetical protein
MQVTMPGRLGLVLLAVLSLAGTAFAAGSAGNPRDPQKRYNAADQSWARSMRISRADLGQGDWRVEQSPTDDSGAPADCKDPNLSDLVITGEAENPDWSRNGSFVGSGAEVWSNERQAAIAWKRNTSVPLARCIATSILRQVGQDPRLKFTVQAKGHVKLPNLAPRIYSYGMRFRIAGPGATLNGRIGFYAFGRGRADSSLLVISFSAPLTPISPAVERHLATLVANRLKHSS